MALRHLLSLHRHRNNLLRRLNNNMLILLLRLLSNHSLMRSLRLRALSLLSQFAESWACASLNSRSVNTTSTGSAVEAEDRGAIGKRIRRLLLSGTSGASNNDQVIGTKAILGVTRVELDDLLEGIERVDIDLERSLGDKEGEALGARRSSQASGILEEGSVGHMFDQGLEGKTLNLGLGAGGLDSLNIGSESGEKVESLGRVGSDVEEQVNDSNGGGIS